MYGEGKSEEDFNLGKSLRFYDGHIEVVLTAVIITSAFEELSDAGWPMYLVGIGGAILLLLGSIIIIHKLNKTK